MRLKIMVTHQRTAPESLRPGCNHISMNMSEMGSR